MTQIEKIKAEIERLYNGYKLLIMKTKIKAALYSLLTVGIVGALFCILTIIMPIWIASCVSVLALWFLIFIFWFNILKNKED